MNPAKDLWIVLNYTYIKHTITWSRTWRNSRDLKFDPFVCLNIECMQIIEVFIITVKQHIFRYHISKHKWLNEYYIFMFTFQLKCMIFSTDCTRIGGLILVLKDCLNLPGPRSTIHFTYLRKTPAQSYYFAFTAIII